MSGRAAKRIWLTPEDVSRALGVPIELARAHVARAAGVAPSHAAPRVDLEEWQRYLCRTPAAGALGAGAASDVEARSRPAERPTQWISATDIEKSLGCARSMAYVHLHRAGGTHGKHTRTARVSLELWECYAAREWGPRSTDAPPSDETPLRVLPNRNPRHIGPLAEPASKTPLIRIVQPRTGGTRAR